MKTVFNIIIGYILYGLAILGTIVLLLFFFLGVKELKYSSKLSNIEALSSSVVRVFETDPKTNESKFICSAASIIKLNTFLSAEHCTEGLESSGHILTLEYRGYRVPVEKIETGKTQGHDWAIFTTNKVFAGMVPLAVDCHNKPFIKEQLVSAGFPYPFNYMYVEGEVTSTNMIVEKDWGSHSDFWTNIPAKPGSSGSAVLDKKTGEVVGILIELVVGQGYIFTGVQDIKDVSFCKEIVQ